MAPNKLSHPSLAHTSVFLPLSPKGEVSKASKPRSETDVKFQSPKQLLTSWLRTNSRKRTHSDSDNKTTPEIKSPTSEPSPKLTNKFTGTVKNVEMSLALPNDQREEHETEDKKENGFNGQKSPSVSPQKKRLCVNTSLNLSSHVKESKHAKLNLNPGKENLTCDNTGGYCTPEEFKRAKEKRDDRCKETSKTTSKQNITTQSKNQVSFPARTQNWLTQWSVYCKAKCGDKNSALAGNECESNATETLTSEDSSADDLQPPQVSSNMFLCTCYFKTIGRH